MGVLCHVLLLLAALGLSTDAQRPGGRGRWWRRGKMYAEALSKNLRNANISYSFADPIDGNITHVVGVEGLFAIDSKIGNATGRVVHVLTENGGNDGCTEGVNLPEDEDWVALIQRGGCTFRTKIQNHAVQHNAAAILVYNDRDDDSLVSMHQNNSDIVSVFIGKDSGDTLAALIDLGTEIRLEVNPAPILNTTSLPTQDDTFGRWRRNQPDTWAAFHMLRFLVAFCVLTTVAVVVFAVWKSQIWKRRTPLFNTKEVEEPASNYKHLDETRN